LVKSLEDDKDGNLNQFHFNNGDRDNSIHNTNQFNEDNQAQTVLSRQLLYFYIFI